jgi:NhaP-type Na+/H+ or K+/H+ antiporter
MLTIALATSLHPIMLNKIDGGMVIIFQRVFFNIFFTMFIGICLAFFSSYFLKSAYSKINHFDNFDIVMIMIPPLLAYLLAEAASISGLLSLMACAFIQSIYAKKNL